MRTTRLAWAAVPLAAALVLAGCGGSSGTTTTTSATASWAEGLCSAVTQYSTAVKGAAQTLTSGNVSSEGLQEAADSVKSATNELTSTVNGLGGPQTQARQTVQSTLTGLTSSLQGYASSIGKTVASDESALTTVNAVSSTLLQAQTAVTQARDHLQQVDAKGEIRSALSQAPSCAPYLEKSRR